MSGHISSESKVTLCFLVRYIVTVFMCQTQLFLFFAFTFGHMTEI